MSAPAQSERIAALWSLAAKASALADRMLTEQPIPEQVQPELVRMQQLLNTAGGKP